MLNILIGFILGLISGIIVEYSVRLMWERHERKILAIGLVAELGRFQKEIREFKSHDKAPVYCNAVSKLHLFKEQTIQNLEITYSDILTGYVGARTHSEIEELSNKIQNTIALLEKEIN